MKIQSIASIAAGALAATLFLSTAPAARATTLLIDAGQCGNGGSCVATNGTVTATAYQPTEIQSGVGTAWANFQAAFNSWDASVGNAWTLATGNLSAEANLDVTLYRAYLCGGLCGGAEINITYNNGGNPPNPISGGTINDGDAVWSQSIKTNQKLAGSLPGNPYLDNNSPNNRSLDPPAYPYQYNGSIFYDKPARDAYAVWLADAWISTADYTNKILTVYDGVEWGFTVVTPLPSTWTMLIVGFVGLGFFAYRGTKKRTAFAAA